METYIVQNMDGSGDIHTQYRGEDWDEAQHSFVMQDLTLCKERWIIIDGKVSSEYHNRYVGAPSWASLSQKNRKYLTEIGITESENRGRFGRPTVYSDQVTFHLRELSADVVKYIDESKGELSRRARLEEIVRLHREGIR